MFPDSLLGLASFTGLAILSDPIFHRNSRTTELCASLFLGGDSIHTLYGSLSTVNTWHDTVVFSDRPTLFFIEATVCCSDLPPYIVF